MKSASHKAYISKKRIEKYSQKKELSNQAINKKELDLM